MCLVALAIDAHERFPLVIAANRDEYFDRPSQPLHWWTPEGASQPILAGRDLQEGGTWMGLNAQGRFALVTNVRNPAKHDPSAPSRGEIVPEWLQGRQSLDALASRFLARGYNGVNLLAADLASRDGWIWMSNRADHPRMLKQGIHGMSNAGLDSPWPKVERLKHCLREALASATSTAQLSQALSAGLVDRSQPSDDLLPSTGVPLEWERWLSPAFIRTPDGRYGTRCSTLLITERIGKRLVTHLTERSFAPGTEAPADERYLLLPDWPPRPSPALP